MVVAVDGVADRGLRLETTVNRLRYLPADPEHAELVFPVMSDPAGWWFDPGARHVDVDRTRDWLRRAAQCRVRDGLSYWTVFDSEDAVVGVGGAQRHRSGSWNLSYRIAAQQQRKGYALELARAGLTAAMAADDTVPVVAWVLPENVPSRRVAERLGLQSQGIRLDDNDGVLRLAYSDRPFCAG
ncbi:MAG: GNAT family N-acetyltransferase [Janthinobacterium lividum]